MRTFILRLILAAVIANAALLPSSAAAYELFGYKVRSGKDPFPSITSDIKRWRFTEAFTAITERMNSGAALSPDEKFALHVNLGVILKMLGKWNDSYACFAEAAKIEPKSALCRHYMAVLQLSARNLADARKSCDDLRAMTPDSPWPYVISGTISSFEGRQERAYSDMKKAGKIDQSLFEVHAYFFNYYKRTGKYELAKKELKKLLKLDPSFELAPFFSAASVPDRKTARSKVASEVLYENGLIMYNYSFEPQMALKYYKDSLEMDPGFIKAKFARAQCLLLLGRRQTARNLLAEIIRTEPAFNAAYDVLKMLDSREDLAPFLGTNLDSQKPNGIMKSDKFCRNCGEPRRRGDEKCRNCRKVFEKPETAPASAEGGADNGDGAPAPKAAPESETAGLDSETEYDRYFERGIGELEERNYESAEVSFRNIVELMPHLPEGYNMLGITYLGMGKNDLAVKNFKKAVSLNRDFAEGYFSLGKAYEIQGKADDAREMYRKSLKINSEYEEARQALENLEKNGKRKN